MSTINYYVKDQGYGFEPNATMAVLHYPYEPLAIWTFDLPRKSYMMQMQPLPAFSRHPVGTVRSLLAYNTIGILMRKKEPRFQ